MSSRLQIEKLVDILTNSNFWSIPLYNNDVPRWLAPIIICRPLITFWKRHLHPGNTPEMHTCEDLRSEEEAYNYLKHKA